MAFVVFKGLRRFEAKAGFVLALKATNTSAPMAFGVAGAPGWTMTINNKLQTEDNSHKLVLQDHKF